uniref:substrate-binding domain-containing protein n=1 Tax=Eubacterium cellulosolvens TaxID=29322 RepID=UPI0004882293|nr:substrate-binding domain-containing protein [[Eubacterium] cellulosolvens]
MKKTWIRVGMAVTMAATMIAGCASGTASKSGDSVQTVSDLKESRNSVKARSEEVIAKNGGTYALVPKSSGNPFNEREADGFRNAVEDAGGIAIVSYPEAATADAQIEVIESLIAQGVDSIAVAANDAEALSSSLNHAKEAGIAVCTLDSDVAAGDRSVFCNQAGASEIGRTLMDAVYDLTGGEGEYAILSATAEATNQNAWIDAMEEIANSDSKYAKLTLDEIAYGDDEAQKSADQTQALLTKYPSLKVILAPTSVGMSAAAKVLQDQGSSVKLTGLGLPSEMREYIGTDDEDVCPYMFLWNPIDLGSLAGYTSIALVNGQITGAAGDSFSCELGDYTVTADEDGATEIILGEPFRFDPSNIDEWSRIY